MNDFEKLPPHVLLESEKCLLGCFMMAPRLFEDISAIVTAEMFWRPSHRLIFDTAMHLCDIGGNFDFVGIVETLAAMGQLEECGGQNALEEIAESIPSHVNWQLHAESVADASRMRTARKTISKWLDDSEFTQPSEYVEKLNDLGSLAELSQTSGVADWSNFHEINIEFEKHEGVPSGFSRIDKAISTGGYPKGQISVVSAYHKSGKTTFKLSSLSAALNAGLSAAYVSFADLNDVRIKRRLIRARTGWETPPSQSLFLLESWQKEYEALCEQNPKLLNAMKIPQLRSVEGISRFIRAKHKRQPLDVVFLDYYQRIGTTDSKAKTEYDQLRIVADKLATLAEETGIAIVIGAQVTPGNKDRETITKGGRTLEENAGLVLRLKRDGDSENIEVEIAFNRFGAQSTEPHVMRFNKEKLVIEE